jgi:hypothetical protein
MKLLLADTAWLPCEASGLADVLSTRATERRTVKSERRAMARP